MTEQRPEIHPGYGEDLAEENGFAEQARQIVEDELAQDVLRAYAQDRVQPPNEAASPA